MPSSNDDATLSNVTASLTAVTLFSAGSGISTRQVTNDTVTGVLYLKYGSGASATSYTSRVDPLGYFECPQPCFQGQITGIWTVADGTARCTEVS